MRFPKLLPAFAKRTVSNRVQRHLLTVVTNVTARGIGLAVFIASLHIALPYLGPVRFGVFAAVAGLASALTFMDLGIGNGLVTRAAQLNASGEHDELRRLSTTAITVLLAIALIVFAVGAALALAGPVHWIARGMPERLIPETRQMLLVFAIILAVSIPANAASRILFGLQRGYVANAVSSLVGLVSLGAIATLPRFGHGMPVLLLASCGVEPFAGAVLLVGLWASGHFARRGFSLRSAEVKSLMRESRDFATLQIGGLAGAGGDSLIVSSLLGSIAVAQYSVAQRIFMLISMPLHILNAPLWAAYADADARGDKTFIRRALIVSMAGTTLSASIAGILVSLWGDTVVNVLTDRTIHVPRSLLVAFSAWTVVDTAGMAFAMYMNGRGFVRPQVLVLFPFVGASITLKVALAVHLGVACIPAASTITYFTFVTVPFLTIFRSDLFPNGPALCRSELGDGTLRLIKLLFARR